MWPPDAMLLAAWEHLTAEPDSAAEFAGLALEPLTTALARREPFADDDDVSTAVSDALLAFLRRPQAYDPSRLSLAAYLTVIAHRKLKNVRLAAARHHRGRIPWDSVELDLPARNEQVDDDLPSSDSPGFRSVIDSFTPGERRVFDLMLADERRTAIFAEVLGIADRLAEEQEAEVKRVKDRIKARLKRAARGTDHD